MNDTLTPKDYVLSTTGATQLPGAARSFPRVVSSGDDYRRSSSHISSLSPTVIRVSHQPRSAKSAIQRSLFAVDQTLTRLDVSSNPISTTTFKVAFQSDIPADVTLAEWRAALSVLFGALLESDAALLTAIYNGEY